MVLIAVVATMFYRQKILLNDIDESLLVFDKTVTVYLHF